MNEMEDAERRVADNKRRFLELVEREPWLTAAQIAKKLKIVQTVVLFWTKSMSKEGLIQNREERDGSIHVWPRTRQ